MEKNSKRVDISFVFSIIIALTVLREVLFIIGKGDFASNFYPVICISVFGIIAYNIIAARALIRPMQEVKETLCLIAFLAYALFLYFQKYGFVYNEIFVRFISVSLAILFFSCGDSFKLNRSSINIYYDCLLGLSILSVLFILRPGSYQDGALVMCFGNPNQCGVFFLVLFMNIYVFYSINEANTNTAFLRVLLWLLFLGCYLTRSRTSMICCILYIIFNKSYVSDFKRSKKLFNFCLFFAIFMPVIYIKLSKYTSLDFTFLGKEFFSGREIVWNDIYKSVIQSPFSANFGKIINPAYYTLFQIMYDAHNSLWEIMWNYSVIGLVIVTLAIKFGYNKAMNYAEDKPTRAICLIMIVCLMHMSFETVMFSSALNYMILIYSNYLILYSYKAVFNDVNGGDKIE